jgi:hypothetical protein
VQDAGRVFDIAADPLGVHVVQHLGDGWYALYHMGLDRPRINSISLGTMAPGPASSGDASRPGEVTTQMLRAMSPAAAIAYATEKWRDVVGPLSPTMPRREQLLERLGPAWLEAIDRREPDAAGRTNLRRRRRAAAAALYVQALETGDRRPVEAVVAATVGLTQSKVRDLLYAARHDGLLDGTSRGRAGGKLTEACWAVLEELGWRGEAQTLP